MIRPSWIHTLAVTLLLTMSTAGVQAGQAPRAALIALNASLAEALQLQDKDALGARMLDAVAMDLICQRVLGNDWRASTPAQREALRTHILALLVNTYSGAMANAELGDVRYETVKQSARSALIVADVPTARGNTNRVKFHLTVRQGRWLVNDVVVEGISLVNFSRASFNSMVAKRGVDGLITHLDEQYAAASF